MEVSCGMFVLKTGLFSAFQELRNNDAVTTMLPLVENLQFVVSVPEDVEGMAKLLHLHSWGHCSLAFCAMMQIHLLLSNSQL